VTGYWFARELLGSRSRAALAAAIVTLSPFTLMLSGTYLNYVFALALYLLFGALLLRGLRLDSPRLVAASGFVLGLAFLTRPYDAILFALPFAVLIVVTRWHDRRSLGRIVGWVALGALVPVAVGLVYNVALTGSPLSFPTTVQSDGYSRFFWGVRSIAPDTPKLDFSVGEAFDSMGTNLWATPTWLFGTYFTLALAVVGGFKLWRTDRQTCLLLIGLVVVFPVGYLAWWASSLTTNGALDGLGPHYYLPVLVPVAVLAAHGALELARHRRVLVAAGIVVAIAFSAIAIPPKLTEKSDVADVSRAYDRQVRDGIRQRDGHPALVVQEHRTTSYIMEPYPYLANPPDLDSSVLYARDRGALNVDLLDRMPNRRAYRLVRELRPGADIRKVPVVVKPLHVVRGPTVAFHTTIVNQSGKHTVIAYSRFHKRVIQHVLDTASTRGRRYAVTWTFTPDGIEYEGPSQRTLHARSRLAPDQLAVGASFAKSIKVRDADASEHRYYVRAHQQNGTDEVEALSADEQWTHFGTPLNAWLPVEVAGTVDVRLGT
jgi:Dolichyl-phosphate-mannose-protein mannosyltransferase